MKTRVNGFGMTMVACLVAVIALTLVLCLADLSAVMRGLIAAVDAVAAVGFALCPTLADLAGAKAQRADRPGRRQELQPGAAR